METNKYFDFNYKIVKFLFLFVLTFGLLYINLLVTKYIWGLNSFNIYTSVFSLFLLLVEIESVYCILNKKSYKKIFINIILLLSSYLAGLLMLNIDLIQKIFVDINAILLIKTLNQLKLNIWFLGFFILSSLFLFFDLINFKSSNKFDKLF